MPLQHKVWRSLLKSTGKIPARGRSVDIYLSIETIFTKLFNQYSNPFHLSGKITIVILFSAGLPEIKQ